MSMLTTCRCPRVLTLDKVLGALGSAQRALRAQGRNAHAGIARKLRCRHKTTGNQDSRSDFPGRLGWRVMPLFPVLHSLILWTRTSPTRSLAARKQPKSEVERMLLLRHWTETHSFPLQRPPSSAGVGSRPEEPLGDPRKSHRESEAEPHHDTAVREDHDSASYLSCVSSSLHSDLKYRNSETVLLLSVTLSLTSTLRRSTMNEYSHSPSL